MEPKSLIESALNGDVKPDQNNVKTFGLKEENKEQNVLKNTEKKQENLNEDSQKENIKPENTEAPENKQVQNLDSQEPKKEQEQKEKPSFKIKLDSNLENENLTTTKKEEVKSITSEAVLGFLKENYPDLKLDKLSDLTEKKELPEAVKKFNDYHKETGRGLKDFYNLQKDWAKEDKDSVIAEHFKFLYPNFTEEQLEEELDLIRVTQDDEDDLGERELKMRKSNYNKVYNEALNFMLQKNKEYATPLEESSNKQLSAEELAELHKPYWNKRDASLKKFNEFKLEVDGIGEIKVPIDSDMKASLSGSTQTVEAMLKQWQEKDGSINTDKMIENFIWADENSRNKMLQSILEQFHLLSTDLRSKRNRRVDLNGDKPANITESNKETDAYLQTFRTGDSAKSTTQNMGQPILK